jgi:hypothetical protein
VTFVDDDADGEPIVTEVMSVTVTQFADPVPVEL